MRNLVLLLLFLFSATQARAEVRFETPMSEGWEKGRVRFNEFYGPILKPILIQLDATRKSSAVVAWLEPSATSENAFVLTLGLAPSSLERDRRASVHELTHALHIVYRPHEESWVQEGVALLSEFLVIGGESPLSDIAYRSQEAGLVPDASEMTESAHQSAASHARYGQWRLFFKFLYEQCGRRDLLLELITSRSALKGVEFIDSLLTSRTFPGAAYCSSFDEFFKEFEIRKFTQSSRRGLDLSPSRGLILHEPRESLPPYSASGYYRRPECREGDLPLDGSTCLQIRLK